MRMIWTVLSLKKKTAALHPVIFFKGMNCSVAISSAVECSESVVCVLWNSSVKLTQGNKQNFSRCMLHSYKYWSVKSCKRRQIKIIIRTGTHWENALLSYHWCTWYSNRVLWIALPAMWSQKCFNKSLFFFFFFYTCQKLKSSSFRKWKLLFLGPSVITSK